jgi:hypothetical protein
MRDHCGFSRVSQRSWQTRCQPQAEVRTSTLLGAAEGRSTRGEAMRVCCTGPPRWW